MKQALSVASVEGFIEGSGDQALVMIHGWPDTYRIWSAQVEYFKNHYRCAYFTLPGFEPNAKPPQAKQAFSLDQVIEVIKAVVDEASPTQPVHLMLHDWGCFLVISLRYVIRNGWQVLLVWMWAMPIAVLFGRHWAPSKLL